MPFTYIHVDVLLTYTLSTFLDVPCLCLVRISLLSMPHNNIHVFVQGVMDTQAAEASLWRTKGKWTMGVKYNATSQARIQNVRSSCLSHLCLESSSCASLPCVPPSVLAAMLMLMLISMLVTTLTPHLHTRIDNQIDE